MTRIRRSPIGLAVFVALCSAACQPAGQVGARSVPSVSPGGRAFTYVAIGASESFGMGADDPARDAWPQVFYRTSLPRAVTLVDLGIPGATVADALRDELPRAEALHPELVTVWLDVNDITHRVPLATYRSQLTSLLRSLRDGGKTKVLVANTPPLDRLPLLLRCRPFVPTERGCDRTRRVPVGEIIRVVAKFNDAIAEVAAATGAVLVDLHAWGESVQSPADIARFVGSDGFHPSAAGHRAIAAVFARAYLGAADPAGAR
jgi:acyl-CoA thioesterase I